MAPGHMIPLVDMARQSARHQVRITIVLTRLSATRFSSTIEPDQLNGLNIIIRQIKFPNAEVGLPNGYESLSSISSSKMSLKFIKALDLLQQPVHHLLKEDKPDCLVSDFFFPWTTNVAAELGIPRIIFHGAGFFPLCVYHSLSQHKPYQGVESDSEIFIVPGLPDLVKMTKSQVPDYLREKPKNPVTSTLGNAAKTELTRYGVIVNSFKELEPAYVEHYRNIIGRKVWHVGPVSLCNTETKAKSQRFYSASSKIAEKCSEWLSTKESNSVVYVSLGTVTLFPEKQLRGIAMGLESSGQEFIWAVRNENIIDFLI